MARLCHARYALQSVNCIKQPTGIRNIPAALVPAEWIGWVLGRHNRHRPVRARPAPIQRGFWLFVSCEPRVSRGSSRAQGRPVRGVAQRRFLHCSNAVKAGLARGGGIAAFYKGLVRRDFGVQVAKGDGKAASAAFAKQTWMDVTGGQGGLNALAA